MSYHLYKYVLTCLVLVCTSQIQYPSVLLLETILKYVLISPPSLFPLLFFNGFLKVQWTFTVVDQVTKSVMVQVANLKKVNCIIQILGRKRDKTNFWVKSVWQKKKCLLQRYLNADYSIRWDREGKIQLCKTHRKVNPISRNRTVNCQRIGQVFWLPDLPWTRKLTVN